MSDTPDHSDRHDQNLKKTSDPAKPFILGRYLIIFRLKFSYGESALTTDQLIELIKRGNRAPCVHHFTDTRNISSIATHGILSRTEITRRNICNVTFGGNQWSFDQDDRRDVSDYVHLCFFNQHPMEFCAKADERIQESFFIKILPEVLRIDGVLFSDGVANAVDSNLFDVSRFEQFMDVEILFQRTDWTLSEIQERLKAAKKYEILVPRHVPRELLRK